LTGSQDWFRSEKSWARPNPAATRPQEKIDLFKSLFKLRAAVTNMICEICSSILQHQVGLIKDSQDHQLYSHHSTASSLRKSVSQGCYICQTFCNELFDSNQGFLMSASLTHLVTHCELSHGEELYRLQIRLAESTNLSNLAKRKGNGSIFVLQPSSGKGLSRA